MNIRHFKTKSRISLRTKVIVPVVMVMVLLMGVTMALIEPRIRQQLENEDVTRLVAFDAVFKSLQESREKELLDRFRNVAGEPRFKAVNELVISSFHSLTTEPPIKPGVKRSPLNTATAGRDMDSVHRTFRRLIDDLIKEEVADVIVLTSGNYQAVVSQNGSQIDSIEFQTGCSNLIRQALDGQSKVGLQQNAGRLYDVVSLPIHGVGDAIVGTITFGVKNHVASEFQNMTHCEVILQTGGQIIASTLMDPGWQRQVVAQAGQWASTADPASRRIQDLTPGGTHYRGLFNQLASGDPARPLSYAILLSTEASWQTIQTMRQKFLLLSLVAVLFGTVVVWFLVRMVTGPLNELRASAEAIGSGDFSRRVEVRSRDECGELAQVFNRMTENLQTSRQQLESTVDRLKATQAQLVQSEKLSGIGEFVAGVAHELNNPLTTVMGFSELLQHEKLDVKHGEFVSLIYKNTQRCQRIVQSLLSFARRHQPERKPASVNKLIEAAIDILQYQLRTSNIQIKLQLDPDLPAAMLDSHQMQQVFVNIINNARQAIEAHGPEGWIKITTETAGANLRISVQDSGPGIPEENLSKIFDPFFTTKEIGKGTGLGLSLCYGIVKEHEGNITPMSRPGEGATFVIELPITREAERAVSEPSWTQTRNNGEGAGKRVLAIDDEEAILQMLRETLTQQGYQVDTAGDGETGLNRLRQNNYDLILCDWKMQGLNGQQVYERLRILNPALSERLMFITGDLVSDKTRQFLETEKKICLPKPFTLSEFHTAIKKILAQQN